MHNATLAADMQTVNADNFIFRLGYITRETLLTAGQSGDALAASQAAVDSIGASRVFYSTMSLLKCEHLDTEYKPFLLWCLDFCASQRKSNRQTGDLNRLALFWKCRFLLLTLSQVIGHIPLKSIIKANQLLPGSF
jgi:hypothetical protein